MRFIKEKIKMFNTGDIVRHKLTLEKFIVLHSYTSGTITVRSKEYSIIDFKEYELFKGGGRR